MKIELTYGFGEYEIDGVPVRIICIDAPGNYPVIALWQSGETSARYADGTCRHVPPIVKAPPWKDFKIDDPVMVRDSDGGEWMRRHFAGVVDGKPTVFMQGMTSWTSTGENIFWNQCRRPTEKEMK